MDRETEREITGMINKEIQTALRKMELDRKLDKIVRMISDSEKSIRKDIEYQMKKEHDNMIREIEKRTRK
ncbi:hypothetical protein BKH42_00885 [Helicobacter sp. 13S00482-2]|uniref:hypothetical protein n=1 Tax=Helicobacter sp. 13S00482-2 TaxID=1476200 RepID=UPI000BA6DDE8|nr:hypothetical protein [Helicobacter sp. 13S00482-2]PAF54496.1 hypothetical protein BKH42_00885 [Helicobacter sp. 13S00482-2]